MNKFEMLKEQLYHSLNSFAIDPADSDYQRGYEASLKDILEVATELEEDES